MNKRKPRVVAADNGDDNRPRNISHLASLVFGVPLLLDDRKAGIISSLLIDKMNGAKLSPTAEEEIYRDDYFGSRLDLSSRICTIYAIGSLVRRKTWLDAASGLVSYSDIKHHLNVALSDGRVGGIILQIDSHGGEAADCFELADFIRKSNDQKPIWGSADVYALSAGYALLSACERCFVAPQGQVGSIGAVLVHMERSKQNEMLGLSYTVLRSLPKKALGSSLEPLPEEASNKYQASLEKTGRTFADLVSRNRPALGVAAILALEGQWFDADEAAALNLVDGVQTFDDTFSALAERLQNGKPEPPPQRQAPIEPEEDPAEGDSSMTTPNNNPQSGNPAPEPAAPAQTTNAPVEPGTGTVVPIAAAQADGGTWAKYIADMTETCQLAGAPERVGDFLKANLSVAVARKQLLDERASAANAVAPPISNANPAATQPQSGGVSLFGGLTSLAFDTKTPMTKEQEASWDAAFAKTRAAREQMDNPSRR